MNAQNINKVRAGQPYLYRENGLPSEVYQIRFHEAVDGIDLNEALQEAIVRYPYFKVRFDEVQGDFYPVPNDLPLHAVGTDTLIPLGGRENNYYLIGVTYSGSAVNVAFHHGLTDGRGIKRFVETLIYEYCRLHYGSETAVTGVLTAADAISPAESADPCTKRYKADRRKLRRIRGLSRRAFTLPETKRPKSSHRRYELKFPQEAFMESCKLYGGSPVILLSIMMSRAIAELFPANTKTINSNFPVDIRSALGAEETFHNCVKSVSLPYGEKERSMNISELCTHYRQLLNEQREPDRCRDEQNKIIMLLDILTHLHSFEKKRSIMRFLDDLKLDTYLISYIGQFNLGGNAQYVESVHLFSDCTDGLVMNMTCTGGYFCIDFIQDFEGGQYIDALCRQLAMESVPFEVSEEILFSTPCDTLMRDMPRTQIGAYTHRSRTAAAMWLPHPQQNM